jgi:hypothetical protein
MKKHSFLLFVFATVVSFPSFSQRNVKDSIIGTPWLAGHYGLNWTQGDLAGRFGALNHIGLLAGYKTDKNWFCGLDANFIFGSKIKIPDILAGLRDSYGNITDQNGDIVTVGLFSRGFNVNLAFGKLFPVLSPNINSGILIHGGVGYLAYKIRLDTPNNVIPQVELDYRKGYDRLTSGLCLHQFVGYSFMATKGFVNFYGGFYFQEGFTKNRRTIFFDTPDVPVSTKTRLDVQMGLKIGWNIPIYRRLPKEYYTD